MFFQNANAAAHGILHNLNIDFTESIDYSESFDIASSDYLHGIAAAGSGEAIEKIENILKILNCVQLVLHL
jgi:hypothetical protein